MAAQEMEMIARALVAPNKGILAADESSGTIEKRFKNINLPSTPENHRDYRELLFTTQNISKYIGGVILFDETIRQKSKDGTPLVEILKQQGVIPGIKVDKGAKSLTGFPGEKITEGLDGLRARFEEYYKMGARFSKWRAVITIGNGIPTFTCLKANAHALARYAALSQEAGIVPIVEPEVLMDGNHTIQRCAEVTELTQRIVFDELYMQRVVFEQMLLKPNMITSGKDAPEQAVINDVAKATIRVLRHTVPAAVPGIVFLSGGQNDVLATEHLNAMNQLGQQPWQLSFSYGRALQDAPLHTWLGKDSNREAAQQAFFHRAECNGTARSGKYTEQQEASQGASRKSTLASVSQD